MANPINQSAVDIKPINQSAVNVKPVNFNNLGYVGSIYMENRVIPLGQPIPWGLNWLITYPAQLSFQGVRI